MQTQVRLGFFQKLEQYIINDTALIVKHHPVIGIASWLKWYH